MEAPYELYGLVTLAKHTASRMSVFRGQTRWTGGCQRKYVPRNIVSGAR